MRKLLIGVMALAIAGVVFAKGVPAGDRCDEMQRNFERRYGNDPDRGKKVLRDFGEQIAKCRADLKAGKGPPPWKRGGPKPKEPTGAERAAHMKTIRADPAAMRLAWSAVLCDAIENGNEVLIKQARDALAAMKVSAIACTDEEVGRIAKCVRRTCDGNGRDYIDALPPPPGLPPWRRR